METKNTGRCFSATEADNILFSRSLEGKWFGSVGLERSNGSIIGRVERSLSGSDQRLSFNAREEESEEWLGGGTC